SILAGRPTEIAMDHRDHAAGLGGIGLAGRPLDEICAVPRSQGAPHESDRDGRLCRGRVRDRRVGHDVPGPRRVPVSAGGRIRVVALVPHVGERISDAGAPGAELAVRLGALWVASSHSRGAEAGLEQCRQLRGHRPGHPALRAPPVPGPADCLGQDGPRLPVRSRVASALGTQGSLMMSRAATIGCVLSLTIAMAGCIPPPPKAPEASGYGAALEVVRDEGWLQREIRRFRTYPHLDRAYRMIATGKLEQAKAEFATYLSIDPQDLAVRFHYLVLLHRLNAHAQVIREADALLRDRHGFGPAILYRALASHALSDHAGAIRDFRAVAEMQGVALEHQTFALSMVVDLGMEHGAPEAALAAADRLVSLQPSAHHSLKRGRVLQKLGRLEEADTAFA